MKNFGEMTQDVARSTHFLTENQHSVTQLMTKEHAVRNGATVEKLKSTVSAIHV